MPGVIVHPRDSLHHPRHARQRPQIGVEAVGARPLAQRHIHLLQLLGLQPRPAPGPARAAQGLGAATPPLPKPATDALAADLQPAGHRRHSLPHRK